MNYLNRPKSVFVIFTIFSSFFTIELSAKDSSTRIDPIVVTANPLGKSLDDLTQPFTVLSGDDLMQKLQPTIGETLANEPGIRSTYFGPNASRPVIRGLQGDQIDILQNGISNLDASATSVDHNVSIDPLSVERMEVVRGPAALLYGSKAVGGVVNLIDNRIPNKPIAEKITGVTDARFNSANNERSGSVLLEGGLEKYAWHLNGFKRLTNNIDIPGFARSKRLRESEPLSAGETEAKNKLANSQSTTEGGTVGLSRFFKKGYLGAALTDYKTNYGTVAEPDVTIDMEQKRADFAGSYMPSSKYVKELKFKLGISDYEHTEFEGDTAGTIFKNRGYSSRVELVHNKLSSFEGVVGLQSGKSDFSALGEEAFLPPSVTNTNSAFILEEVPFEKLRLQMGGRFDYQDIDVEETTNFGAAQSRNDLTGSSSFGFVYDFSKEYAVALSTSYTQRAPNAQELYANGNHVATDTYEVGDKNLDVQKSQGLDLSLRKKSGIITGEVNFFYNRFQNFITLVNSGTTDDDSGSSIYNYVNLPAAFYGGEIKVGIDAYNANSHKLNFEVRSDYVEARNTNTGEPLPRISPPRVGGSAIYNYQKLGLRLDTDYTFAQNHVSESELATDGYLMVNASTEYRVNLGITDSAIYLKATNLLNEEARNHVSFLKDKAPLAGRSVMIGIKSAF